MLSITRNLEVFNADRLNLPVHIIGCGALGSKTAIEIAKLGIQDISLYDYDTVEIHNLNNQAFLPDDIGKSKVEALRERIIEITGNINVKANNKRVEDDFLSGIVIVTPDSMKSRKEIFENCCQYNPGVKLVIEARMGLSIGRVYTFSPSEKIKLDKYEKTLYCDEEVVETGVCGTVPNLGSTSSILSGMITWQMIKYYQNIINGNTFKEENGNNEVEFEILVGFNPFYIRTSK